MSTTRSFSAMLNDYMPDSLLREEFVKRDYFLSKVEKDNGWLGASTTTGEAAYIVPFKAAGASSVSFGQLTGATDVSEDKYVRGRVNAPKEVWGTMIFNHRDLMEHDKISEKNFLKLLPNTVEDFMDYMKNVVSMNLMNGANFDVTTAIANANNGLLVVKRPDKYMIGQKLVVTDGTNTDTVYVTGIVMDTKTLTVSAARGGAVFDFSAGGANLATAAKVYNDGAQTANNAFSSLRGALLSAANGGDAALYGVTKTLYPYLQAINVDGSSITASNIMEKIFDALTTIRQFGKGKPSDIVMSYTNFGSCLKAIEASKGSFNVSPGSQKASQYGWTEIEVGSVTGGGIKLVATQEMDEDVIYFLDWRGMKFASNGFFRKRKSPDGIEYFEVRAQSGFQYLVDVCLFGELIVERPSYSGILYGISY